MKNEISKEIISGLKQIQEASRDKKLGCLSSIFPLINPSGQPTPPHSYISPQPLSRSLPPPPKNEDGSSVNYNRFNNFLAIEVDKKQLKLDTLLYLLEKYGAFVPADNNKPNLSCYYSYEIKELLAQSANNGFVFISLDLSGIQDFIYTISSTGALKMLRARSLYLELLGEYVLNELLAELKGSRLNVVFSGGGSFLLLLPKEQDTQSKTWRYLESINEWLFNEFQGKLCLASANAEIELNSRDCPRNIFKPNELRQVLERLARKLEKNKKRKFMELILKRFPFEPKAPKKECQVCHRDDYSEDNEEDKCPLCVQLHNVGSELPKVNLVAVIDNEPPASFKNKYITLGKRKEDTTTEKIKKKYYVLLNHETVIEDLREIGTPKRLLVLDPNLCNEAELVSKYKMVPLFTSMYARRHKELPQKAQELEHENMDDNVKSVEKKHSEHIATFEGLAEAALGAKRIGVLRVDVDNLGLIFSRGLQGEDLTLPNLMRLSAELNYFFKLHLDDICRGNMEEPANMVKHIASDCLENRGSYKVDKGKDNKVSSRDVVVVYSGGDDLFIVGAWNDIAELGVDIQRAFREYTCHNPDITLSGGFTIHQPKYPIHRMAELAGEAEEAAKDNKADCIPDSSKCSLGACQLREKFTGNCLRKNSYAPFYSPQIRLKQKKLEDKYDDERIKLALKWNEMDKYVLNIVENLVKAGFEPDLKLKDNRSPSLNKDMPRSLFVNLFNVIHTWRNEGLLYIPRLAWVLAKMRKLAEKSSAGREMAGLLSFDQKEKMSSLHIALTWLDLLHRGGGE